MSAERHLNLQELILRPCGEWIPRCNGWVVARVAEGTGYWMQPGTARELNAGDGFVAVFGGNAQVRASQLGPLKLQFFTVQPQFLNGLLTVAEWHQLEVAPDNSAPRVLFFSAGEPAGQKFAHIAGQPQTGGLPVRCALLQLWADALAGWLARPLSISSGANKLRDRFRQVVGQMLEAELSECSLGELAGQLHCSERHFSRLFREEFGVPLRARQIELRLQRARQLLAGSDAKVINVAFDSGYRHLGLFNAMFKKRFGLTPSEWRLQSARKIPTAQTRNSFSRAVAGAGIILATLGIFFGVSASAQTNAVSSNEAAARVATVSTNSGPRFRVDRYDVEGNSILPPGTIAAIFTNVPAAFGTNVTIDAILAAAGDLQSAYRERGYMTVNVGLPPQKLTNAVVKVKVTEARLAAINVEGNRWFSSNNVMRALPDLRTNILLNAKIFQRELDAANLSRDRTIYPVIGPGPEPGTSELTLKVKDTLPLHARLEVNNQATPGTPDLRAAFNSQYDNLWGLEHQAGLQYSFSFDQFKGGNNYSTLPFDAPQVANYSAYYRLPLGGYPSVQNQVDARPQSFGYNEQTHQFNLPTATGRPELTLYGSRSTADTGVQYGQSSAVTSPTNNLLTIVSQDSGENFTLNENLGGRVSVPVPQIPKLNGTLSFGFDFKRFRSISYNSNNFVSTFIYTNQNSGPASIVSTVSSPQPARYSALDYLPLNAGFSGSVPDKLGTTFFNASASFNPFSIFSKSSDFAQAAYSPKARADYFVIQAGADREQKIYKGWSLKLHADGQWADSPLFSNEQYAMGGTSGVRGYANGEAYGDEGWRVMIEPELPPWDIGMFGNEGDEEPCRVRASLFMDCGEIFLLDPQPGGISRQDFLGVGWAVAANIGSHLDGRIAMGWPLTATAQTRTGDFHIYFAVGAQF
jgi:hemolysin activation/secretion protein/AraC-like DNA-binding protein